MHLGQAAPGRRPLGRRSVYPTWQLRHDGTPPARSVPARWRSGPLGVVAASRALGEPGEWDVLEDIPPDTAAAILLIEHHWAIPLREAIVDEGGVPLGDAWITIPDLVANRCPGPRGGAECQPSTGEEKPWPE